MADHRLAVVTGGQRRSTPSTSDGDALAELEPVGSQSSDSGLSRKPDHSFGKKYVDFCGITRPGRRHALHLLDGRRAQQERRAGLA